MHIHIVGGIACMSEYSTDFESFQIRCSSLARPTRIQKKERCGCNGYWLFCTQAHTRARTRVLLRWSNAAKSGEIEVSSVGSMITYTLVFSYFSDLRLFFRQYNIFDSNAVITITPVPAHSNAPSCTNA